MDEKRIAYLISFSSSSVNQDKLEKLIIDIRDRGYLTKEDEKQFFDMRIPMTAAAGFFGESMDSFKNRIESRNVSHDEVYKILKRIATDSKKLFEKNSYLEL